VVRWWALQRLDACVLLLLLAVLLHLLQRAWVPTLVLLLLLLLILAGIAAAAAVVSLPGCRVETGVLWPWMALLLTMTAGLLDPVLHHPRAAAAILLLLLLLMLLTPQGSLQSWQLQVLVRQSQSCHCCRSQLAMPLAQQHSGLWPLLLLLLGGAMVSCRAACCAAEGASAVC
jgi:hypothetical protein